MFISDFFTSRDSELIENAFDGNLDGVHECLRRGANVNAKNKYGNTALINACYNGNLDMVHTSLNSDDIDVNIKNNNGDTALTFASHKGHLDVVRALLNRDGIDVNIMNIYGNTALICASGRGHLDVVRALLNHNGINVNIQNENGDSALDLAREQTNDDIVRFLETHMEEQTLRVQETQECCVQAKQNSHDEEQWKRPKLSVTSNPPRRIENSSSIDDLKLDQDRDKLLHVMNTTAADPVELSLDFIKQCIKTDHGIGSGAYSDVFLVEDNGLPKKFAVKMISPTHCDQDIIEEIRKIIETELAVSSALSLMLLKGAMVPLHEKKSHGLFVPIPDF